MPTIGKFLLLESLEVLIMTSLYPFQLIVCNYVSTKIVYIIRGVQPSLQKHHNRACYKFHSNYFWNKLHLKIQWTEFSNYINWLIPVLTMAIRADIEQLSYNIHSYHRTTSTRNFFAPERIDSFPGLSGIRVVQSGESISIKNLPNGLSYYLCLLVKSTV